MRLGQIKLIKTSPNVTIQDLGRHGFRHLGITPGGAADKHASCWANHLLNNSCHAALLECPFGNTTLQFLNDCHIAITGASTNARINTREVSTWCSHRVKAGDTLHLGFPQAGVYTYIAISHGIQCTRTFGSCASTRREDIGPKALQPGDTLHFNMHSPRRDMTRKVPHRFIPDYHRLLPLRLIEAAEFPLFSKQSHHILYHTDFEVQPDSNKMGARLNGEQLEVPELNLLSEGVVAGTVQVPPNGQPIVLLAEHQTLGGYPKLGTIYRMDSYLLSQRRPGQAVRFTQGSLMEAQLEFRQYQNFFSLCR